MVTGSTSNSNADFVAEDLIEKFATAIQAANFPAQIADRDRQIAALQEDLHQKKLAEGINAVRMHAANLQRIGDLEKKLAEVAAMAARWKQCVRYMQELKRPRKKIRHVPTFNSQKRAKLKVDDWVNAERIFLREWRRENNRGQRHPILASLLSENANEFFSSITQRDAVVAATVIQWLGTNVGSCFVDQCLKKIKKAHAETRTSRYVGTDVATGKGVVVGTNGFLHVNESPVPFTSEYEEGPRG